MNDDLIKIKGTRSGLALVFAEGASFEDVEGEILERLQSGSGFFVRGTEILAPKEAFPREQMERLKKIFQQHGILFRTERRQLPPEQHWEEPSPEERQEDAQQMLVVNHTLRGGQEICTRSSVLVCGNVNPGAQIIAGGSIDVRGTCRGIVHAGAYGNSKAVVIADRLMPMQIRIANLIARAPDNMEQSEQAERASIKDGQIVIEPIER